MSAQTILVVEDNPLTRKMLRLTLESEGYSVLEAGNRTEALAAAAACRLDLVVLDYVLPDTDGLRLLAEVRREAAAPELPALVVTGMVSRLEELRARAGTFAQVLPKPIESPQLLEFVRAHLAGHEGRGGGRSILLIDDEPLNLKLTALRLEHSGYHVETASEAREGLEKARRVPPDVILSDVLMPSMDGFAFCLAARSDPRVATVPVVVVSSAYIEEADRELARKVGANALVVRTPEMREALWRGGERLAQRLLDSLDPRTSSRPCTGSGSRSSSSGRRLATRSWFDRDPGHRPLGRQGIVGSPGPAARRGQDHRRRASPLPRCHRPVHGAALSHRPGRPTDAAGAVRYSSRKEARG